MKYIKFTYLDSITGISVSTQPAVNGPKFPEIKGLEFKWEKLSKRPTQTPEFFGVCDDDSNTTVEGVLDVLTKEQYSALYAQELAFQNIVPQVISAKQIRLRLLDLNLLDKITLSVSTLPQELQIEWNYGTEIDKNSTLITELSKSMALPQNILDEIFMVNEQYQELKLRKQELQEIESEQT